MENDLSRLMAQIAAAEKDAKLTTEGTVRVATRMLDVPTSRDDFVSANRGAELQAQRTADMQGILNALGQFVRFTVDVGTVVDPAHYQEQQSATGVPMDAKYGNAIGDWHQNERAQQFALGLFAVMNAIRQRYSELKQQGNLDREDEETFVHALQELQRLAAGVQWVDQNTMVRLQAVGEALHKLQSDSTSTTDNNFRELRFARKQAVGYLAAPYGERADPLYKPEIVGEQLLGS